MSGDELELVQDAFASNWITSLGPHVEALEAEVAERLDVPYALALSSGTAALHLALRVIGVDEGQPVVCSSLSFVASANPILYERGAPMFVDSESKSWNMDPELLAKGLEDLLSADRRPAAVIAVDIFGQCADYDRIEDICARYDVPLLEDAAEALGATHGNRQAGAFGQAAVLSFNGNKIITTSGGGMLVSRDQALIEEARHLSTQARDSAPHYEHSQVGYNYRLSNLLAALGRGQLRHLDDRVRRRRSIFDRYSEGLCGLPGLSLMPESPWGLSSRWLTCITVNPLEFGADREMVRLALAEHDIEARPIWKPLHLQPLFAGADVIGGDVSECLFDTGLCLPSGSALSPGDQERVISIIRDLAHAN